DETSPTTDPDPSETNKAPSTLPKPWNGTDGSYPPQHTGTIDACGRSSGKTLFAQLSQGSKYSEFPLKDYFLGMENHCMVANIPRTSPSRSSTPTNLLLKL